MVIRPLMLLMLCLGGCSDTGTPAERAEIARTADNGMDCALAGAEAFQRQCTFERGEGGLLTIHHPDGGFRRLQLRGGELLPADGADQGTLTSLPNGRVEWSIDRDRYRLPAP
jgi:hypothetical protein